MSLPTFLIIGAAKAGTNALYHDLRQHPQHGANDGGQIERQERRRHAEALACSCASREAGGGREQRRRTRIGAQALDQRQRREHFADRGGVQPEGTLPGEAFNLGVEFAETLP